VAEAPAAAILLAAGLGTRLGSGGPKGLVEVGGRSLVAWAVAAVDACAEIAAFVLTVPAGESSAREAEALAREASSDKLAAVVAGGGTRQASVRLGLEAVPGHFERVVCHDVARPFARPELFSAVLAALEDADGAVPVVPASDTLKRVAHGRVLETIDRGEVASAQTPQAFRRAALDDAHRRVAGEPEDATDDAVLLERAGFTVAAVPGDPDNLKVTVASDLRRAEAVLAARG
jgi:2-C-methyl-D-erythritol 4-phosphate cytidylyltransferase / 2-C-methyl-D-erythritol 2,4-cyclodiphosphate synthase